MSVTRAIPKPNFETTPGALASSLTSNPSFFVRTHFDVPAVDLGKWHLAIRDQASRSVYYSYDDLTKMRQKTVTATLECAGNGRTGFSEIAEGKVPWGAGAVGTARWSGVTLRDLISRTEVNENANRVLVEGEDSGPVSGQTQPVRYARVLPMEEALRPQVVLALKMNSDPLPVEHGFPARLIVPGWYGMASVKWVRSISVVSGPPLETHFNTRKYVYLSEGATTPVREMRVKSPVTSPRRGGRVRVGHRVAIRGKAWSGDGRIVRVEVKVEGKKTNAHVAQKLGRYAWAEWILEWRPENVGEAEISVKATDSSGNIQPEKPFENQYQYGFNAVRPVKVSVLE